MPYVVKSRRVGAATREAWERELAAEYGSVRMLDLTSQGPEPWVRFSPFYPHGGIPVPFSPGVVSQSVEGIWQGLKVFEHEDVDPSSVSLLLSEPLSQLQRKAIRVNRRGSAAA